MSTKTLKSCVRGPKLVSVGPPQASGWNGPDDGTTDAPEGIALEPGLDGFENVRAHIHRESTAFGVILGRRYRGHLEPDEDAREACCSGRVLAQLRPPIRTSFGTDGDPITDCSLTRRTSSPQWLGAVAAILPSCNPSGCACWCG